MQQPSGVCFFNTVIKCVCEEFSRELSSEGSQPHIVARLVERAESSEVQLAQAQQELRALKQAALARAAAEGAGTSAALSAAQVRNALHICIMIHISREVQQKC